MTFIYKFNFNDNLFSQNTPICDHHILINNLLKPAPVIKNVKIFFYFLYNNKTRLNISQKSNQ